mmetsp:Transcript_54756/g.124709  ORF Transcript_54756/g.124709 Transcript_54756/m.124709 type:complete len:383 (+) Transcript_54756:738-1886(+)
MREGEIQRVFFFCLPCIFVAHLAILLSAAVGILGSVLRGAYDGISCAGVAYRAGNPAAGISHSYRLVLWFDHYTNESVFGCNQGTFGGQYSATHTEPFRSTQGPRRGSIHWLDRHPAVVEAQTEDDRSLLGGPAAGGDPALTRGLRRLASQLVALDDIWDSFFSACAVALTEAHGAGWVARADVEDAEPYLLLGCPGLVLLEALERSIGAQGVVLMDPHKTEVTEANRPRGVFPDHIFGQMIKLRDDLGALVAAVRGDAIAAGDSPSAGEGASEEAGEAAAAGRVKALIAALRQHTATCGGDGRGLNAQAPHEAGLRAVFEGLGGEPSAPERLLGNAMDILAGVQSLATDISRAPTFRRRFAGVLQEFERKPAMSTQIEMAV